MADFVKKNFINIFVMLNLYSSVGQYYWGSIILFICEESDYFAIDLYVDE